MGELHVDEVIDLVEYRLLQAFNQEGEEHQNHGQPECQSGGVERGR